MNTHWEDAIKRGDLPSILALLEQGADVNARDRYGQTALMLAAHTGYGEVVEALIVHQAKLDITAKFGLSALMLAVIAGQVDIARLLVKAAANLSLRGTGCSGFSDKTTHDLAVERGMRELAVDLQRKP